MAIEENARRTVNFSSPTLSEIAVWTKTKFVLETACDLSTISRILKTKDSLLKRKSEGADVTNKRMKAVKYPSLDEALANWAADMEHRKIFVSYDCPREKAVQL